MARISNTSPVKRNISIADLQAFGCDWIGEADCRSRECDLDIEDLIGRGSVDGDLFDEVEGLETFRVFH